MKILVFARLREVLGSGEIDVPTNDGVTTGDLRRIIAERRPEATALLAKSLVAVNNEYVGDTHPISLADTVALIPPVSGG
jgi:molybdopterin converting factor subunit 1